MKVLLLYPEFPTTFWSFKHALAFVDKSAGMPPLGLLTVAAMLPADWELRLVDMNVTALQDADLAWADCVFVSAMMVQRESTAAAIAEMQGGGPAGRGRRPAVHRRTPGLPGGGPSRPERSRDHAAALPGRLGRQAARSGRTRPTSSRTWRPRRCRGGTWWTCGSYATTAVQFSRGCPFDCEFCNITTLFGHRPRVKTADQIIAELDLFYRLGWRGRVFFVDDNLIGNRRQLKEELLPAIIEWRKGKSGMPFNTEASINLADDAELMRLMVEAGFDEVFIGIETPEESSLAECNKKQNVGRDLIEDVKRIQRAGLEVQGGFILGFDSDTPSTFQRQIDFIQQSGIVTAMVGLLQAPPATRLWQRMEAEGRLTGDSSGNNVEAGTNILPKMPLETLTAGYKAVVSQLYAPEQYYARALTFLREVKPPKFTIPMDASYVRAFFRSVGRLGIVGQERRPILEAVRVDVVPAAETVAAGDHHRDLRVSLPAAVGGVVARSGRARGLVE